MFEESFSQDFIEEAEELMILWYFVMFWSENYIYFSPLDTLNVCAVV